MTIWADRSREERALLNPALCAVLLWHGAFGHSEAGDKTLALEEAFLVLPIVLDRKVREALPRNVRTSLPVWLQQQALVRGRIAQHSRLLREVTREGLLFGALQGILGVSGGGVEALVEHLAEARRAVRLTSVEVRECAKRAEFVGRWFARSGSAATVLAVIGVRP